MSIKNIAPNTLTAVQVGGTGPKNGIGVGTIVEQGDTRYIYAKIIPGTGSVTGAKQTSVVPYYTSDAHTAGEFTHDLTDCPTNAKTLLGIQMFSMMTAVTHYGLVAVRGPVEYLPATTNPLMVDGASLVVSTTDNRLNATAATTTYGDLHLRVAILEADNDGLTAVSSPIRLLGQGYL